MKLSQLVSIKNQLDQLSVDAVRQQTQIELDKIFHVINSNFAEFNKKTVQHNSNLHQVFNAVGQDLVDLKQQIQSQIDVQQRQWFQESYRLYDQEMVHETDSYILNRRMSVTDETKKILLARLQRYGNWHYPAMILRPALEDFVDHMVMFDPLYLVDQSYDLLLPSIEKFTIEYQRRLRIYTVKERTNPTYLDFIPDQQLGLVFAYNYFNFKPLEVLRQYLTEIYEKLRPGGTLVMTFNDCDRDKAVMLVEQSFACYTPGSLVKEFANTVGYQLDFEWNDGGPSTWLEITKPGTMTSLRGGQTLAKIVPKSLAQSK